MAKSACTILLWLCWLFLSSSDLAAEPQKPTIVFAASSLTDVLQELATNHAQNIAEDPAILSFGASATMARQIDAGAPADVFISANEIWTKMLLESGRAKAVLPLISNRLVIVSNKTIPEGMLALRSFLRENKLAIADPALAPAGQYAKTFLNHLFPNNNAGPELVFSPNVRQNLRLAQVTGLSAIVYRSDVVMHGSFKNILPIAQNFLAQSSIRPQACLQTQTPKHLSGF